MPLRDLPLILTSMSFAQLGRAIAYAMRKTRLDSRLVSRNIRDVSTDVGVLQGTEIDIGRGRFTYDRAELEITVLAEDLVRITWTPGELPTAYAIVRSDWRASEAVWRESAQGWEIVTRDLHLVLDDHGRIEFRAPGGEPVLRSHAPTRSVGGWIQRSISPEGEHLYGLGERAAPLDLRGGRYRMWNTDPAGLGPGVDPLYLCVPVYIGLHPKGSYLVFHENSFDGVFDFTGRHDVEVRFSGGALRYYFIPGPPMRALQRYTELTGRPPMPPIWALGYHHARWGYRDQADLSQVVRGFREHDLTLDALHLDIDHMRGFRVFTVDRKAFPDLKTFAGELATHGTRLVGIVDPGVKVDPGFDVFVDGKEQESFCRLPSGQLATAPVWPGWAAFPDFTSRRAREWWAGHYERLLRDGITGVWHDMNEPATFSAWGDRTLPLGTLHELDGRGGDHAQAHNLYALQMARAGYEALRNLDPEHRPFILTRSGWAGIQRYAWTWTGDTRSDWETLRQTIPSVLGLSLSGIPYSGPDIGGFTGNPDTELFIRWFQMATFLPFFRNHSAMHTRRREPWVYGEPALSIVRAHMQHRRKLRPYLYTLAWIASTTGLPIARPVFWAEPDREELWSVDRAFLLGDDLLVAPVLEPGALSVRVEVPKGRWFDFYSGNPIETSGAITLQTGLERIPVLVRGGSMLPLLEGQDIVVHVYPAADDTAEAQIYLDAGDGYGTHRVITLRLAREHGEMRLFVVSQGDFTPASLIFRVTLHGMRASTARLDGEAVAFDGVHAAFPVAGAHVLSFD